jgi:opacity protein-like surface antigen
MFKKIAAAAALAFAATSAFAAAPTAFYGGVDAGSTKVDDFGDNKASFGGFLGYGFNQNFAVELGYRQLGKWDVRASTSRSSRPTCRWSAPTR